MPHNIPNVVRNCQKNHKARGVRGEFSKVHFTSNLKVLKKSYLRCFRPNCLVQMHFDHKILIKAYMTACLLFSPLAVRLIKILGKALYFEVLPTCPKISLENIYNLCLNFFTYFIKQKIQTFYFYVGLSVRDLPTICLMPRRRN
jgi:hypothetical protein